MPHKRCIVLATTVVLLTSCLAMASPANQNAADSPSPPCAAHELTLNTERVVIFKDGYALFLKSATATADEHGVVYTDQVPDAAVLGSFWAFADDTNEILAMRAEWVTKRTTHSSVSHCLNIPDIIRANVNHHVTLDLTDDRIITGRILDVLSPGRNSSASTEIDYEITYDSRMTPHRRQSHIASPGSASLFVFESDELGQTVLQMSEVKRISSAELITRMKRTHTNTAREKRLSFELGAERAGREVKFHIAYFTPGVRWIPTYRLAGALTDTADLALQAEILNEAEDIDNAAIDLVVGVPNFRFKDVISPLSLEEKMLNALHQAAPGLMSQHAIGNQFTNRAGEWRNAEAHSGPEAHDVRTIAPDLAAGASHDLFVYHIQPTSLKKGARATLPLWQSETPIAHLYTMDLHIKRNGRTGEEDQSPQSNSHRADNSPIRLQKNRFWHQLELRNTSNVPWTTGAALLMDGALPLGQDLLAYTARGAATLLPVTVAIDVQGAHHEYETDRKPDAARWNGHSYTQIWKRGEIEVMNYRPEAIRIRLAASVAGEITEASDEARITINGPYRGDWHGDYYVRNNHSDAVWEMTLEPGETRTLTYDCTFYVWR